MEAQWLDVDEKVHAGAELWDVTRGGHTLVQSIKHGVDPFCKPLEGIRAKLTGHLVRRSALL